MARFKAFAQAWPDVTEVAGVNVRGVELPAAGPPPRADRLDTGTAGLVLQVGQLIGVISGQAAEIAELRAAVNRLVAAGEPKIPAPPQYAEFDDIDDLGPPLDLDSGEFEQYRQETSGAGRSRYEALHDAREVLRGYGSIALDLDQAWIAEELSLELVDGERGLVLNYQATEPGDLLEYEPGLRQVRAAEGSRWYNAALQWLHGQACRRLDHPRIANYEARLRTAGLQPGSKLL